EAEEDQAGPEGLDLVLDMALPHRALHLVALHIGDDDADDAEQMPGKGCDEVEDIDDQRHRPRRVAHCRGHLALGIRHRYLPPRSLKMWGPERQLSMEFLPPRRGGRVRARDEVERPDRVGRKSQRTQVFCSPPTRIASRSDLPSGEVDQIPPHWV